MEMHTLNSELEAAMEAEITPKVLDILVEIAKQSLYHDDKTFAVQLLVMALQYPMRDETLAEAEQLYTDLETQLCPRVIHDAYELAQRITLEEMVTRVLTNANAADE
jgi:hypothetical protein